MLVHAALAAGGQQPKSSDKGASWVEMTVEDVFRLDSGTNHVVLLKGRNENRVLPIWIGESEALAISLRLARKTPPRPLTHDLLLRMLVATGAQVTKIQIEDLRDATFLGRIFVKFSNRTLDFDARPSDAIVLALAARAPIWVARKVLDQAGIDAQSLGEGENRPPNLEDLLRRTAPPPKEAI